MIFIDKSIDLSDIDVYIGALAAQFSVVNHLVVQLLLFIVVGRHVARRSTTNTADLRKIQTKSQC